MAAGDGQRGSLNPGALVLGITSLIGVLGSLTLTGTVGRVLRNQPDELTVALVLVLLGAAAFAAAALPLTARTSEAVLSAWGIALSGIGLVVGIAAAVKTMDDVERPAVAARLEVDGLRLQGKVKVANLRSEAYVTLLVDGLRTREEGDVYDQTTVHHAYVGPDGDGEVDLDVDVRMPPGRFDAVGVRAWTDEDPDPKAPDTKDPDKKDLEDPPCKEGYPRRFVPGRESPGPGCTVLPLPAVPVSPRLALSWMGEGRQEQRLRVAVAADNAPVPLFAREPTCRAEDEHCEPSDPGKLVALTVTGRTPKDETVTLHRALLRPDVRGHLHAVTQVPVSTGEFEYFCAQATFAAGPRFPGARCEADPEELGRTVVELRPTPAKKAKKPTPKKPARKTSAAVS